MPAPLSAASRVFPDAFVQLSIGYLEEPGWTVTHHPGWPDPKGFLGCGLFNAKSSCVLGKLGPWSPSCSAICMHVHTWKSKGGAVLGT
jgi:hypothetical protein